MKLNGNETFIIIICQLSCLLKFGLFCCRHCLAYAYGLILKQSLEDFRKRWNSHRIRQNRLAGCPPGVPDDLYYLPQSNGEYNFVVIITAKYVLYSCCVGTRSYKHPLDFFVWSHGYLECAYQAPPFYPEEFEAAATGTLNQLGITREDITTTNAREIFLHLCSIMI